MFVRIFGNISANGSADLRSPEKEVCFRSWDFANSQMCEVRVATSNICGCNPPNRCGERSGADFATSLKAFLNCDYAQIIFGAVYKCSVGSSAFYQSKLNL